VRLGFGFLTVVVVLVFAIDINATISHNCSAAIANGLAAVVWVGMTVTAQQDANAVGTVCAAGRVAIAVETRRDVVGVVLVARSVRLFVVAFDEFAGFAQPTD
jgi:hypothetical protein